MSSSIKAHNLGPGYDNYFQQIDPGPFKGSTKHKAFRSTEEQLIDQMFSTLTQNMQKQESFAKPLQPNNISPSKLPRKELNSDAQNLSTESSVDSETISHTNSSSVPDSKNTEEASPGFNNEMEQLKDYQTSGVFGDFFTSLTNFGAARSKIRKEADAEIASIASSYNSFYSNPSEDSRLNPATVSPETRKEIDYILDGNILVEDHHSALSQLLDASIQNFKKEAELKKLLESRFKSIQKTVDEECEKLDREVIPDITHIQYLTAETKITLSQAEKEKTSREMARKAQDEQAARPIQQWAADKALALFQERVYCPIYAAIFPQTFG